MIKPKRSSAGYPYWRYRRKKWPKWYRIDKLKPGELPGVLIEERVRCGKPTCKCASREEADRHGPYIYRIWRDEDGRQRKAYVKRSELEQVRAAIERRELRLAEERDGRKRHMRRGEYSWKAQNASVVSAPQNQILKRVLRNVEGLRRLRGMLAR